MRVPTVHRRSPQSAIHCPFCGGRHYHDGDGWRVAHCNTVDVPDVYYVKTRAMDARGSIEARADAETGQSFMVPSGRDTSEMRRLTTA